MSNRKKEIYDELVKIGLPEKIENMIYFQVSFCDHNGLVNYEFVLTKTSTCEGLYVKFLEYLLRSYNDVSFIIKNKNYTLKCYDIIEDHIKENDHLEIELTNVLPFCQ